MCKKKIAQIDISICIKYRLRRGITLLFNNSQLIRTIDGPLRNELKPINKR